MDYKKLFFTILIIIFGVIFRIFLNETIAIPNFEAVTALSLLSGVFVGGVYSILIPLSIMFFSDLYFGNTFIYLFTWSAFVLIGISGNIFKRDSKHYLLKITGSGVLSVLFFYLWTNLGWWLISGMYPMSFSGLIQCYIAALAFLKNQLISVILFVLGFNVIFSFLIDKVFSSSQKVKKHGTFILPEINH